MEQLKIMQTEYIETPLIIKARDYAIARHSAINQKYGEFPYEFHLLMVVNNTIRFIHLLTPEEAEMAVVASYLHDTMEDTGATYNDIKKEFGKKIANVVYNLTNEKGKDRKERAFRTYPGIASCKISTFVKNSDRLANTEHSYTSGSSMYKKYVSEYPVYKYALQNKDHGFAEQWEALEKANLRGTLKTATEKLKKVKIFQPVAK